jgi:hypothetical protein
MRAGGANATPKIGTWAQYGWLPDALRVFTCLDGRERNGH